MYNNASPVASRAHGYIVNELMFVEYYNRNEYDPPLNLSVRSFKQRCSRTRAALLKYDSDAQKTTLTDCKASAGEVSAGKCTIDFATLT